MDQAKALSVAAEAFELVEQGRYERAEERYRTALSEADPKHHRTPDIHGEYASLLTRMNRAMEAGTHYERALELELRNDPDEAGAPVLMARYLLGEHYLRLGEGDSARRVIAPSLAAADQPLAWLVEAEALWLAGSVEDARAAGGRALALCTSDTQRERMRARLAELWEAS
jgi:tetratricopeptide (TPR) repeat protein